MKFKPTLGRWLWVYPLAVCINLVFMYNYSGPDSFLSIVFDLVSVVLIIAGAIVFYSLLFTRYELGENELIIRHAMSEPIKIPYKSIHSINVIYMKDMLDFPSNIRSLMSLDALEVWYLSGKRNRSVILISPKDKEEFQRELEGRLEVGGANAERSYQYEV